MNASPITKITSWLKFLGKNLHLVGCATLCAKSEVMLILIDTLNILLYRVSISVYLSYLHRYVYIIILGILQDKPYSGTITGLIRGYTYRPTIVVLTHYNLATSTEYRKVEFFIILTKVGALFCFRTQ